jgi:hypothetical protein
MPWNVGVLIIGSLFWRMEPHRVAWRKSRLNESKAIPVFAPIRYGRLSLSKTYTMVFAPGCQLGTAKAVPCVNEAASLNEVYGEAQQLWIAECRPEFKITDRARLSGSWGCVALLPNPASQIPQSFLDEWAERVSREHDATGLNTYNGRSFVIDGQSAINDRGILQIPWPTRTDTNAPLSGIDLLLATATRPKFAPGATEIPNEETIAAAWQNHPKEAEYFWGNRKHGIHTFQDPRIEELLAGC